VKTNIKTHKETVVKEKKEIPVILWSVTHKKRKRKEKEGW